MRMMQRLRSKFVRQGAARRSAAIAVALLLLACLGCRRPRETEPPDPHAALSGVTLKLLVVGDDALAQSIGRLRGEWQAQTHSQLQIEQRSERELASEPALNADAVIYPAYCLGPLAERELLAPIAQDALTDPELDWSDIFERDKSAEVTWGTTVYAVPLGSPSLTCFYRADLLERLGRKPPRTWAEYRQLAELLADRSKLGDAAPSPDAKAANAQWSGAIEPLAPGSAGLTLSAQAAPYARHPSHYSTLFNMNTMEPLVAGPPFVRALTELVDAQRFGTPQAIAFGPLEACRELLEGRCGMAVCWTSAYMPAMPAKSAAATDETGAIARGPTVRFSCCELPGADKVYNPSTASWEPHNDRAVRVVPLLGLSGRIGSAAAQSNNPDAARRLLFWLASPKWSQRISPASPATTLFRPSQVSNAQPWCNALLEPPEAHSYALAVQASMSQPQYLYAPRIPGRERYLTALDEAVQRAVSADATPQAALDDAAMRWREITADLGVPSQRRAYRRCLGLEP